MKTTVCLLLLGICQTVEANILWHFQFTGEDSSIGGAQVSGIAETNGDLTLALDQDAGLSPFFSSLYDSDKLQGARGLIRLEIDDFVISNENGIGFQNNYSTIDWSHPNQEVNEAYLPHVTSIGVNGLTLYHERSFGLEEVTLYSDDLSVVITDSDSSSLIFAIIPESSYFSLILGLSSFIILATKRKV